MNKTARVTAIAMAGALAWSGAALAAGKASLDVTMTVISDEEPFGEAMENVLMLPDRAALGAREAARGGLERANQARTRGREFGDGVSDRASDMGEEFERDGDEFGKETSSEARALRGEVGADIGTEAASEAGDLRADIGAEVSAEAREIGKDLNAEFGADVAGEARELNSDIGVDLGVDIRTGLE